MFYLDKRDNNGLLLIYSAYALANRISIDCFERTKETEIYKILKSTFEKDYLEIYFKKFYYIKALPIAHKIVLNDWAKKNKSNYPMHKININLFPAKKYLGDFLTLNNIEFKNEVDINVIKVKFLELLRNTKFFLKRKIYYALGKSKTIKNNNVSIGVSFTEGIQQDKRSDLFWLENSKIDPNDVLLFFDYPSETSKFGKKENLLKRINKLRIRTIQLWEWDDDSKVDFIKELIVKLNKMNISSTEELALKKISLMLIKKIEFWYLFFKKLNIKILHDHYESGTENIVKQLALRKLDGCSVGKLRSHIGEKSYLFLGYYPNDIFFVPSKDSGRRLINHSFNKFQHVIVSGFPFNLSTKNNKIEANKIKNFFNENNKKFIVLLLDESHSSNQSSSSQMLMTSSVNNFYNNLLDKFSKISDIGIIIKPKKLHTIKSLKKVYAKVLDLEKKGICYLVKDPLQRGSSQYASIINLAIQISSHYPSALLDCVFKKRLGVFLDIANLKSIEKEWYGWGEKKVIFNDTKELVEKILEYKNDKLNHKDIGDWSNQKDILDPFNDDLGSERVGKYLNILLNGFKKKYTSSKSILMANNAFSENWGQDKIIK